MIRALLLLCALVTAPKGKADHGLAPDLGRLADCIRSEEGYRGRPGTLGEEGPYQIRAITWQQHMRGTAFAMARQEGPARACALKHLAWLSRSLEARGVPASAFNLAAAWNAGLERYVSGRAPERAYAYARRVESLYLGAKGQNTLNRPAETISRSRAMVVSFIVQASGLSKPRSSAAITRYAVNLRGRTARRSAGRSPTVRTCVERPVVRAGRALTSVFAEHRLTCGSAQPQTGSFSG